MMIDWWNVAGHAVWILGAAIVLARFSYRRYEAAEAKRLGLNRKTTAPDRMYRVGLLLFCAGLGVTSTTWVERGLWTFLAIISIVEPLLLRPRRALGSSDRDDPA